MSTEKQPLPLVYSCSGRANVAQLSNDLAVVLDHEGYAQMACIAGVGGDVNSSVLLAKSGRSILAIDGCDVGCVKKTLARHEVTPKWHLVLTSLGLKKQEKELSNFSDMKKVLVFARELIASDKTSPE